jgi:hypothetical protein
MQKIIEEKRYIEEKFIGIEENCIHKFAKRVIAYHNKRIEI